VALANPFELAAQRYFTPREAEDPVDWVKKKLRLSLWSKQREIMLSIRDNRYTAVHACHDSGKSFTMSVAGGHHLDTHKVGDAFLVSTAPSATQVDAILWREIRKIHKLGLRGRILSGGFPQWYVGDELIGYGRKPQDYDVADVFQGIHAPYVLVVLDEANGLPKAFFDAADTLATNAGARVVAIGNPDDSESHFHTVCQPGSGWNVIHIDGLQTPNFNAKALETYPALRELFEAEGLEPSTEDVSDAMRMGLLDPLWVVERMPRWGVGSSLWQSKVRGLFPGETSKQVVIPLAWVEAAVQRWYDWDLRGRKEQKGRRVYGVDVAREGDDESAIATSHGEVVYDVATYGIPDTMALVSLVDAGMDYPGSIAVVDVVGVGGGVVDRLRQLGRSVVPFSAGSGTTETDLSGELHFDNVRSAAWWMLREELAPWREPTLCLPPDELLKAELCAPRYKVQGTTIVVESKEQIKKRLKRSTDRADAVIQARSVGIGVVPDRASLAGLSTKWGEMGASPLARAWEPSSMWERAGGRL
jgi:hypothetical protein